MKLLGQTKSSAQRLSSCLLVLLVLVPTTHSAVVAETKIKEMFHQARVALVNLTSSQDGDLPYAFEVGAKGTELAQPLSLQLAVLRVTNALNREMNLPKWQAMLRALGGDREILKRFAQMRYHFDALKKQLNPDNGGGTEEQLEELAALNTSSKWAQYWPKLMASIQTVDSLHDWFDRYQRNSGVVNERTLRDYAETVHGKDGITLSNTLESIHELVCPSSMITSQEDYDTSESSYPPCSGGAIEALQQVLNQTSNSSICMLSKSPHHLVYDFYTLLALTDAKGYAMMQFSWMLLRLYDRGSTSGKYVVETSKAREAFQRRTIEKAGAAKSILKQTSIWKWRCDASAFDQFENESYVQFNELLQGYVVNEVDLNQDNTCKESCSAYSNSQEKTCFGNQFCAHSRRCPGGRIYNCGFVEADSNICTSGTPGRRYDWIEYKSGRVFGQKSECNAIGNQNHKVNSWWRWVFWHCSYCMCLCDQPGLQSDRYVSLQTAKASSSNRLVTGVRFMKKDRVVHIQIQEGEALPRGLVNESSIAWKPIEPVTIPESQEDSLEDGPGYATLSYEQRALDLDDLIAPEGHVVTGLRFRKLGGHLNLEVQVSPIDFSTGLIDVERETWISNDNTPASETQPRTKLTLFSPDVPTRSRTPSIPDSFHDQFVEFQASSLEKDVSQNTVPFIETAHVTTQPPTWLTGIGIYHKGQPGFGGYVAFRIATIDFSEYLNVSSQDLSENEEDIDLS